MKYELYLPEKIMVAAGPV